ncbi:hypothetical protein LOTGIDRAFT_209731 [Lottia gigantea]|uniref:NADH dehydrogenase [ubiquinone] 1 alpha subcomplex subunit 12 n=1 Tax=Lottia gigantea TaxID=225164 RepID=V3ZJF3_LOTGI|nr:hypothetical protein LOTGIDRAFT_209731 [Lottia gigantea]ESO91398.1 hypothetical protein LOTGIDRAFT_209731 [Lottia gigantea]
MSKTGILDKLNVFRQIIKDNGGLGKSIYVWYKTDDMKTGDLVGEDKFGNKYYQNNYYFFGRNRWAIYSPEKHLDYDASQIPPEWHRWLQYISDVPPVGDGAPPRAKWMADYYENRTATSKAYVPYSTVKPKIQSWSPNQS